ncbi:hypothetical protein FEM48_Zijuj06G0192100 [Ziziphus jujuba var. spinosa]|uniref:Glycosyltransferase N-terminal domain-containing protein n=1 Tax=Ziziphus jujuba var. spinosa TaxID=714518 RepID=A0A978VB42_ZIZJJ|nr:hypothetical protein FEM48_Zijuj06G0192100 [Ziziphus jujuba var. spinosa]
MLNDSSMATQHRQQHDQNKNGGLKGTGSVIVIMVPFSLQSHMNQLLQLSCLISSYNVPVHYLGSTFCNSQSIFASHSSLFSNNFPQARRVVIIHDVLTSSAVQDARSVANAESYTFNCASAFNIFSHYWEEMGKPSQIGGHEISIPINNLYLPSVLEGLTPESIRKMDHEYQFLGSRSGELYNTSRSIEGNFLGLLSKLTETTISNEKKINIWAMGPLNPVTISSKVSSTGRRDKCLEWLDNQKPNSVMYICFGTTISMTNDQIEQVAVGLEQSGTKFIWVFRDADKGDHCTRARACCRSPSLPQGKSVRTLMASDEGDEMRKRAADLGAALRTSTDEGGVSRMEWDSFVKHILRS